MENKGVVWKKWVALGIVIILAVGVVAAFLLTRAPEEEKFYYSGSIHSYVSPIHRLFAKGGEWYARDHGWKCEMDPANWDVEREMTNVKTAVELGADVIFICGVDEKASAKAVEYATDRGVPVATYDCDVDTPLSKFCVQCSNKDLSTAANEHIVEFLKNRYGEPKGTVIMTVGDLRVAAARERTETARAIYEQYPNIHVEEVAGSFIVGTMREKVYHLAMALDHVDAVFNVWGMYAMESYDALKDAGYGALRGEENHVYIAVHDTYPEVLEAMKRGEVDGGSSYSTQFFLPVAIHIMNEYLEKGESAIPRPGDVLTTENFVLHGEEHLGVDVFKEQTWSPAYVSEFGGHPVINLSAVWVTPDIADNPILWSNLYTLMYG